LGLTNSGEPRLEVLRTLPTNDASAGSQFGEAGIVGLNALVLDPSTGVVELPTDLEDRANQVTPGCGLGNTDDGSEFVVTGRGGLPPNPNDPLVADGVNVPWVVAEEGAPTAAIVQPSFADHAGDLVESQGIALDAEGNAYFVAAASNGEDSPRAEIASQLCNPPPHS
jgi:large exoprotein involved in heme utilization and adhesion